VSLIQAFHYLGHKLGKEMLYPRLLGHKATVLALGDVEDFICSDMEHLNVLSADYLDRLIDQLTHHLNSLLLQRADRYHFVTFFSQMLELWSFEHVL
jgi:hypothetical protein